LLLLGGMAEERSADAVYVNVKWSGRELAVALPIERQLVADLKRELYLLTRVPPERQKLLGLKPSAGKTLDESHVAHLALKKGAKIMMMGTPEEEQLVEPEEKFDVLDDFVYDPHTINIRDREENIEKLQKRVKNLQIKVMNPPRPGKKCLVLDIDYTLFDHRSTVENVLDLMRPYLHEFLTAAYPHYDIIIWSATSMKWVDLKMKELGVFTNPNYKITFCLDCKAMITVAPENKTVFDTKGLGVIWGKFPEYYSPKNTIHFDDLRRNFIMNPQNGLLIRPFKHCLKNRGTDQELLKLTEYLIAIAELDDFSDLDHDEWEDYVISWKRSRRTQPDA